MQKNTCCVFGGISFILNYSNRIYLTITEVRSNATDEIYIQAKTRHYDTSDISLHYRYSKDVQGGTSTNLIFQMIVSS